MKKEIDFLDRLGTKNIPHDTRNLYDHLVGVYELLKSHGRPEHEQRAGLFHAIYGTEFFNTGLTITRDIVKKNIGEEAEEIAYIFCTTKGRPGTGDRRMLFMGGLEWEEPLRTSLRWLDYLNAIEQHDEESMDMVFKNTMHLYRTILNIDKRI